MENSSWSRGLGEGAERVLSVISAYSGATTGQGGHYYSLRDITSVLHGAWKGADFRTLVLGDILPAAFSDYPIPISQVSFRNKTFRQYFAEAISCADDFSPTVVHAYDNKSYFFARLIAMRHRAKVFLTKPGGPNPGFSFPICPDVVCFSEENLQSLAQRRRMRPARFHFIPNRIAEPVQNEERIADLKAVVGNGDVLLRIARIGPYHRHSIVQTINLGRYLRQNGFPMKVVLLGTVEDKRVLKEMRELGDGHSVFVHDPIFTTRASELLSVARIVVGTGRGLVEAAMLGKLVVSPLADTELPSFVTTENWRKLSATNFSERSHLNPADHNLGLEQLMDLLIRPNSERDFARVLSSSIAAMYGFEQIPERYASLYRVMQPVTRKRRLDLLMNFGSVAVAYARSRASATPGG